MSIAWGSLVLLLLLLPGFLFVAGLYIPEAFTRETAERSPLGQLALTLLVAFGIHVMLIAALALARPVLSDAFQPSLSLLVKVVTLDGKDATAVREVGEAMGRQTWRLIAYISLSCVAALSCGYFVGRSAVRGGIFKFLSQHQWIHRLSAGDNLTSAYVLTTVRHDSRILMYRGFVRAFAIKSDGSFAYLTLQSAQRMYMHLEEGASLVTPPEKSHTIGAHSGDVSWRGAETYFVIEGSSISNVVFERFELHDVSLDDLEELYATISRQLNVQIVPTVPDADSA